MTIDPELLLAGLAVFAALATAVITVVRWVESQERAKYEQVRRDIRNEVLAEVYSRLLELNVSWLSSSPRQRATLEDFAGELKPEQSETGSRA